MQVQPPPGKMCPRVAGKKPQLWQKEAGSGAAGDPRASWDGREQERGKRRQKSEFSHSCLEVGSTDSSRLSTVGAEGGHHRRVEADSSKSPHSKLIALWI